MYIITDGVFFACESGRYPKGLFTLAILAAIFAAISRQFQIARVNY